MFIIKTFRFIYCLEKEEKFKLINIVNRFLISNSYFRKLNKIKKQL